MCLRCVVLACVELCLVCLVVFDYVLVFFLCPVMFRLFGFIRLCAPKLGYAY